MEGLRKLVNKGKERGLMSKDVINFKVHVLWPEYYVPLSPKNSHIDILMPNVIVSGGGAFGRCSAPESVNGISALIKKMPQSSLALPPCKDTTGSL